jgi:uncharacterized protein (DUF58 family)
MPDLLPILLGLFVLAALLRIDTYFTVLYLLALTYVLGRIWARRAMHQIQTHRRLVNRAFPGEEIPVSLAVTNDGWLPVPWVEIHDSLPVDLIAPPFFRRVLSLGSHQTRRFQYTLSCRKRGYYTIGPMRWHTGDLLGFTPQLTAEEASEYVIIYPRIVPLQRLGLPTHSPLASLPAPHPLFEDTSRVIGVRPYQAGDSPRHIHWTASAHTRELLVKRYRPAIARETMICLDLDQENYPFTRLYAASELAIVTAASIANHIIVRESLPVGLATQAIDPLQGAVRTMKLPPRQERTHLMGILEILARAQSYRRGQPPRLEQAAPLPLVEFLRDVAMRLTWGTTLVVITGRRTESLIDTLAYLKREGLAIAIILIMPEAPSETDQNRGEMLNLPVYQVWQEDALEVTWT